MVDEYRLTEADASIFSELMQKPAPWSEDEKEEAVLIFKAYRDKRECLMELVGLCQIGYNESIRAEMVKEIENQISQLLA